MNLNNDAIAALGVAGVIVVAILVSLAINIFICFLLQDCYKRIPPQFRKWEPGLVWLLLIPCFSVVWNFFIFPGLSKSFKAYFDSVNRTDVSDCQEGIGLAYAICTAASIIPYLGCLTGIAALVLLIIFLVKTHELKGQIPAV